MGSDPQYAKYPLLPLAQHIFTLTNPAASKSIQQTSLKSLQDAITEHKMAPFYRYLAHPSEGILNASGVSTSHTEKPLGRKPSATGLVASKTSIPKVDLPWDEAVYERLKKENDEELEGFQKEEEEAAEKAGDTEVQAARGKRAEFWARVGDKVLAHDGYYHKSGTNSMLHRTVP
jgi:26S proteasome regulatory subunit N7